VAYAQAVEAPQRLCDGGGEEHVRSPAGSLAVRELLDQDAEKGRLPTCDMAFDRATGVSRVIPEPLRAAQLQGFDLEPGLAPVRDLSLEDLAAQVRVTGAWPVRRGPFVSAACFIRARRD
jgi:hypothetical protein